MIIVFFLLSTNVLKLNLEFKGGYGNLVLLDTTIGKLELWTITYIWFLTTAKHSIFSSLKR